MNLSLLPKTGRSWPYALALSLLLHTSLLFPLLFLATRSSSGERGSSLLIDTRTSPPITEISLMIDEPRSRHPAGVSGQEEKPSQPEASASRTAKELGVATAAPSQTVPEHETGEEQEFSSRSQPKEAGPDAGSPDPSTGNGTTTFFQIAAEGQAIVYVIDRSASMGLNGCLATAKRELLASLERLPSASRFQVIAYNRCAEPLRVNGQSGLVFATPENKRCVSCLLEELQAEGGTDHVTALRRALSLGPEVIYFLTDSADLRVDQIRAITSMNHGRSIIHAIELGRAFGTPGDLPLSVLARQNQGRYKCLPPRS